MADRSTARTISGRRGFLWAALALLLVLIVVDLMRGEASLLRAAFAALSPTSTPGEEVLDRVLRPR